MLLGHNPGIQDLALSLARAGSESPRVRSKFPTAALATLKHTGPPGWSPSARARVVRNAKAAVPRGRARGVSGYAYLAGVAGAAFGITATTTSGSARRCGI